MKEKNQLWSESRTFIREAKSLIKKYYDSEELEVDFNNTPDDIQEKESYIEFFDHLVRSIESVDYLAKETEDLGKLYYDSDLNRYCYEDNQLHCGETFEALLPENRFNDYPRWFSTRIESSDKFEHSNGWYLVGAKDVPLDGLKVRKRIY